jgi:hypothetical protein
MIQTPKPKRKHPFVIVETGETVYLDRIQNATTYFVCDSSALSLDDNYFPIEKSKLKEVNKIGKSISTIPKPLTAEKKTEKQELNEFFASLKVPYNCMECNKPLYAFNPFAKRCVSAHILPKSIFKSIATNPDNIIFLGSSLLGVCEHHNFYDQGIKERTGMKIFPLVLERYEKLKEFLTEAEIVQSDKYLGISNDGLEAIQEAEIKESKRIEKSF